MSEKNTDGRGAMPTSGKQNLMAAGRALREKAPRKDQRIWKSPSRRAGPIEVLRAGDVHRLPELLPIKYGRMLKSPFTFFRGSAAIMAADLAATPSSGIRVQACGDCHLMNFGGFASPERRILFDINDLDETLPAPWEWDVKRLVTSFVLASRSNGLSERAGRNGAVAAARSYREHMRKFVELDVLDIWYSSLTSSEVMNDMPMRMRAVARKEEAKAVRQSSHDVLFTKLVDNQAGEPRIRDRPPLIYHPQIARQAEYKDMITKVFACYRECLQDDRQLLLDRYELVDAAVKVVGIGSVGTVCMVLLLMSMADVPLFLQLKEAGPSVLEPFAGASKLPHHGQRVVLGQRLLQPASDLFLGWATGPKGRHFYIRQLRDVKIPPLVEAYDAEMMTIYARICGWALARAHARSAEPWTIAGYLGGKDIFDEAMGEFAIAYADQAERDHAKLQAAVRAGTIDVRIEE
jgi:uncharacterized protein (DUF2252 family)